MMTEEQKAKAKVYRDSMSEAQKERLRIVKDCTIIKIGMN